MWIELLIFLFIYYI